MVVCSWVVYLVVTLILAMVWIVGMVVMIGVVYCTMVGVGVCGFMFLVIGSTSVW